MNVAENLIAKLLEMGGKIVKQDHSKFGYLGECVSGHCEAGFERTTIAFDSPQSTFQLSRSIFANDCWTQGRDSYSFSKIEVYNNPELIASFGESGRGIVFAVILRDDRRHDVHYTLSPEGIREAIFG